MLCRFPREKGADLTHTPRRQPLKGRPGAGLRDHRPVPVGPAELPSKPRGPLPTGAAGRMGPDSLRCLLPAVSCLPSSLPSAPSWIL